MGVGKEDLKVHQVGEVCTVRIGELTSSIESDEPHVSAMII